MRSETSRRRNVIGGTTTRRLLLGGLVLVLACSCSSPSPERDPGSASGKPSRAASATASEPRFPAPVKVEHHTITTRGFGPRRLALADGSVWVGGATGTVERLAAGDSTPRVVGEVGAAIAGLAVAKGNVFVGDTEGWRVLVYDERTGRQRSVLRMPGQVRGLVSGLGSVWITAGDLVVRLDPRTLRISGETAVGGNAAQVAVSGSSLIVTNLGGDRVSRLDASGAVTDAIAVGGLTIGVAVHSAHVWVFFADEPVARLIDAQSFEPGRVVNLPGVAFDAVPVGDEMWATIAEENVVARLSKEGEVRAQVEVGRQPVGIRTDGTSVWVATEGASSITRLEVAAATVGR